MALFAMHDFLANYIIHNLFLGTYAAAVDENFIFSNSVTHVISCNSKDLKKSHLPASLNYLGLKWENNDETILFDQKKNDFQKVLKFIASSTSGEHQGFVLIVSSDGTSRSIVLMAAYLIHQCRWPPLEALQFIATRRLCANPRVAFVQQLILWSRRLDATCRRPLRNIFSATPLPDMTEEERLHRCTFMNTTGRYESAPRVVREGAVIDVVAQMVADGTAQLARGLGVDAAHVSAREVRWSDHGTSDRRAPAHAARDRRSVRVASLRDTSAPLERPFSPDYGSPLPAVCAPRYVEPALGIYLSHRVLLEGRPDPCPPSSTSNEMGIPVSILAARLAATASAPRAAYPAQAVLYRVSELRAIHAAARKERGLVPTVEPRPIATAPAPEPETLTRSSSFSFFERFEKSPSARLGGSRSSMGFGAAPPSPTAHVLKTASRYRPPTPPPKTQEDTKLAVSRGQAFLAICEEVPSRRRRE
eukprot:gnl/Chilomastix_cuspidata/4205.p1 GENE.gnl/Chilomastix_cuspidata/4205~~gnl/Chilomastix_cuspidata/4205.p1  ORF type:complete len:486 (-),score=133.81 gnl/Chilomastix_cuspidata/4205:70-1497(-)